MARHTQRPEASWRRTTPFPANGRPSRVARLFVLEMVLWPGLLFVGGTLLVAYQVRGHPAVWPFLGSATVLSLAVAVRQWSVMLRAVFPASAHHVARPAQYIGEDSPRLTGRGTTEG